MKKAYTLVELMVVLAVIGIVAAVSIYGLGTSGRTEDLRAASREMVGNLRSLQNKVINGAGGVNSKKMSVSIPRTYNVDGVNVTLKNFLSINAVSFTQICFVHPAVDLAQFTSASVGCTCLGPVCNVAVPVASPISITINGVGGTSKVVRIEHNGKQITRIYEQ